MAQVLEEDSVFHLPSEFLPEDLFFGEETMTTSNVMEPSKEADGFFFNSTFFDVKSTKETESDDESYTAGLTRQMTHSFLFHDDEEQDMGLLSTTVCGGQAARMRLLVGVLKEEVELQKRRVVHRMGVPSSKPALTSIVPSYYRNLALTHQQLQFHHFYQLKHQQMLKQRNHHHQQQQQQHLHHQCSKPVVGGRPMCFPSSPGWPPLKPHHQQQVLRRGPGARRAVFLSSPRQSCGGTGVFLPRRAGDSTTTDFRSGRQTVVTLARFQKNQRFPNGVVWSVPVSSVGCSSTVLLPEKVVQALNLDLDKVVPPHQHQQSPGGFLLDHDARNKAVWLQKQRVVGPRQSVVPAVLKRRQYDRQQW